MWRQRIAAALSIAALLGAPGAAWAQDIAAASRFVEGLYAGYHGDGADYLGRQAGQVFSPRLRALLKRDRQLTPAGDVGALDGDPICDCQDFEISQVRVEAAPAGKDRARATARFVNLGKPATVRFDLVATPGGWRIDNLHSPSIPDLAGFLRQHAGGR